MPIRVDVPGHGIVEFPDGTDEATMTQALRSLASPAPEGKSLSGFAGNIVTSGAKLATDTVSGLKSLAKFGVRLAQAQSDPAKQAAIGREFVTVVKSSPQIARALLAAGKERYGSGQNILNTLYTDPVGVLADVATVAGTVATGGAGAEALLARAGMGGGALAGKIAGKLAQVERVTNPIGLAGRAVAPIVEGAGTAVMRAGIRPSVAVAKNFGGTRSDVVRAIARERTPSAANAERKLAQSTKQADDMLAAAEASGAPAIPSSEIAQALTIGEPAERAALRTNLGVEGASDALVDRAKRIGQQPDFPLTRAQQLKREAQTLAYESDRENQALDAIGSRAVARSLRGAIEQRVPDVGPINERSQRLIAAKRALAEAEDRPHALGRSFATAEAAGALASGHWAPGVAAGIQLLVDSPRLSTGVGIGLHDLGKLAVTPELERAILLRLLSGEQPPQ